MSFGAGLAEGDLGVSENGGYLQFMDDHDIYIYIYVCIENTSIILYIYINPYWRGRWRKRERESYITTGFLEFSGHPIFRQIHFLIRKSNFHTGQNVEMFHFF